MAVLFGIFWSALLAASFALVTDVIPALRRSEGMGYAGIAGTLAVAISPSVGLAIYRTGWYWAFGTSAAVAFLSVPYFLLTQRLLPDGRNMGKTGKVEALPLEY